MESVWTRNQATVSLRDLVGKQGLVSKEICVAFGEDWGSNETCSRRGVDIGNPASREAEE